MFDIRISQISLPERNYGVLIGLPMGSSSVNLNSLPVG